MDMGKTFQQLRCQLRMFLVLVVDVDDKTTEKEFYPWHATSWTLLDCSLRPFSHRPGTIGPFINCLSNRGEPMTIVITSL